MGDASGDGGGPLTGEAAEQLNLDAFIAQGLDYREKGSGFERLTRLLALRLGATRLDELADLPAEAVGHRLGAYGAAVRRRARGEDHSLFAARTPPPELDAQVPFEPPLDSVEAITLERAAELLAERRSKGPAKRASKRTAKKTTAKKSTAKKTTKKAAKKS